MTYIVDLEIPRRCPEQSARGGEVSTAVPSPQLPLAAPTPRTFQTWLLSSLPPSTTTSAQLNLHVSHHRRPWTPAALIGTSAAYYPTLSRGSAPSQKDSQRTSSEAKSSPKQRDDFICLESLEAQQAAGLGRAVEDHTDAVLVRVRVATGTAYEVCISM